MVKVNKALPPFSSSSSLCLLELAANNQICQFRHAVESGATIDKPGYWYCRQYGNGKMALEQRTPAMVAALYGSYQVLSYILDLYKSAGMDVNVCCGSDSATALHCAISGASESTAEIIRLLLDSGADPTVTDARGQGPGDLIWALRAKVPLEIRLSSYESVFDATTRDYGTPNNNNDNNNNDNNDNNNEMFLSLFSLPESSVMFSPSSPSSSSLSSSPNSPGLYFPGSTSISSSAYNTDEFCMYSFKVRACVRTYVHDWTECAYAHPGEKARRRDPRRFHYSCVPCPDFRKGSCKRGDACAYAHSVFESWLHPAQYRTRLCKDTPPRVCTRKVCFFAHSSEELRPLFIPSTMDTFKPTTFLGSRLRTTVRACDISNTNTDTESDTDSPPLCFSPQARLNNNNNNNNSNNMQSQPQYSPFRPPSSITQDPHADCRYPHVTTPSAFSSNHNLGSDLTLPKQKVNGNLQKSASFDFRASKEPDPPWVRTLAKEIISCPTTAASDWGSFPTGKPEWKVNGDQLRNFRKSTSFDFWHASEEPDLSWVQTLVKDNPTNLEATTALVKVKVKAKDWGEQEEIDEDDSVLCSWVERLHLDQIIA